MPCLIELQRGFAAAVLGGDASGPGGWIVGDGVSAAERLGIYRNTVRITLTMALRLTFPAVERLVGAAFFEMAAARFLARHPPQNACLDDYGAGFADFLAAMPACARLGYLPDVARFEHALGVAAHASEAGPLDLAALSAVDPSRHDRLRFVPHPSVVLLRLDHPADHIADAVMNGDDDAMASVDPGQGAVHLLVHRGADGVCSERLDAGAHALLVRLFGGEALGAVLHGSIPDAGVVLSTQLARGRIVDFKETAE